MKTALLILSVVWLGLSSFQRSDQPAGPQKGDSIHVVGHAHMDMNWLWTYSETMKMCNDNLRQAVAFMKEFPDYTMVQSQAAVYRFVEAVDPPLFEEVKKYVKEGRFEPVGGMWTEGDANLSSGEAITRSFLLGQRYFRKHFGKTANVGWLPDNFGHVSQMPQILKLAGCDYFYFHRCKPHIGTFWWEGSDRSRVLCYGNDTYNGDITLNLKDELARFAPKGGRILQITGVGDHGGGPTRENIEMVHQLDRMDDYPAVKFTTARDFFEKSTVEAKEKPVHHGEMQFIFEGCYTTVSEIKSGNRDNENMLYSNEFFNTLRWLKGDSYPADEIRDLWITQTFNQFHDILPGSAINEANKEAIARYTENLRKSTELRDNAFRKMADEIKFQTNMGQPVVAFNLQPFSRKAIVEASVYSHQQPVSVKSTGWGDYYGSKNISPIDKGQGEYPTVLVRDATGKTYPAQIVWSKVTPPGFTSKVQFVVDEMPAMGYKTFYVDMTRPGSFNEPIPFKEERFETDLFTVKVNMKTGAITGLYDKRSGKEYVQEGKELNRLMLYLEDKKGGMKSWTLNRIVGKEEVNEIKSVKIVENGPVRACIETVKHWGKSSFTERTYIYRSYPRIEYEMEVHWLETGTDSTDSPMLRAHFPLAFDAPRLFCQVPFDVVERPANGSFRGGAVPKHLTSQSNVYGVEPEKGDGQEVPAQKWVDVTDGESGIALLNKTKYGHSYHDGELRLTLMRAAGSPDIYPNLGKFVIRYALFPHVGDWKSGVWMEGDDYNVPVLAAEPPSLALGRDHATQPEEQSFFSVSESNVAITGIKQSEEGDELIVRLVETEGRATSVTVQLPVAATAVRRLNLIEMPLQGAAAPVSKGSAFTVGLKPHEIATIGIRPR